MIHDTDVDFIDGVARYVSFSLPGHTLVEFSKI
jgi:hypothetical protein